MDNIQSSSEQTEQPFVPEIITIEENDSTDTTLSAKDICTKIDDVLRSGQIKKKAKAKGHEIKRKSLTKKVRFQSDEVQRMLDKSTSGSETDVEINDITTFMVNLQSTPASQMDTSTDQGMETEVTVEPVPTPSTSRDSSLKERMPMVTIPEEVEDEVLNEIKIELPPIGSERRSMEVNLSSFQAGTLQDPPRVPTFTRPWQGLRQFRAINPPPTTVNMNTQTLPDTSTSVFQTSKSMPSRTIFKPAPNYTARVLNVLSVLLVQGYQYEKPFTIIDLSLAAPNEWYLEAKILLDKVNRREPLSAFETLVLKERVGFYYHEMLCRISNAERSTAAFRPRQVSEYSQEHQQPPNTKHACEVCKTGHADPTPCPSLFSNGPRHLLPLAMTAAWRPSTQGIIIGFTRLYYLPPQMKSNFINLGCCAVKPYPVGKDNLFPDVTNSPLYTYLANIITVIGPACTFPIMVEFTFAPTTTDYATPLYYLGFLRVLKEVQKLYCGPVIMMTGITSPYPSETEESYEIRKIKSRKSKLAALALGQALGVPVMMLDIQHHGPSYFHQSIMLPNWADESLFGTAQLITREYNRRLTSFISSRIKEINKVRPLECGLNIHNGALHDG